MAYVERNPVRTGMVEEAGEWRWSSAQMHLGEVGAGKWLDLTPWRMEYTPQRWREVLRTTVAEEAEAERIREATHTGKPLGDHALCARWNNGSTAVSSLAKPARRARTTVAWQDQDSPVDRPEIGLRSPSLVSVPCFTAPPVPSAAGLRRIASDRWRSCPQRLSFPSESGPPRSGPLPENASPRGR